MKRHYAAILLGSVASFSLSAQGAEPSSQKSSQLAAILQQEANGQLVNRREQLAESTLPADDTAAWHAGRVKLDAVWRSIEELSGSEVINRYLAKRKEWEADPQKHLKLARWCLRHDYPEQARAHFYGVLVEAPNDIEARKALGHIQVGDQWIDQAELKAAQARTKEMFAQLDVWVPKLADIAQALKTGAATAKARALADLDQVDAAAAIPALEMFAINVDDDLAMPMVRKIAMARSREACSALVRVGLAHRSADVRRQASKAIRTYPESFYIPELLGMLSGEVEVENKLVMQPNGHIALTTLVRNELQNRKQLQRFEKHVKVISAFSIVHTHIHRESTSAENYIWSNRRKIPKSNPVYAGTTSNTINSPVTAGAWGIYVPIEVAVSATENLRQQGKQREYLANRQNRLSKEQMNSVFTLLRETTGETIGDEPKSWWTWWNERYERYESAKPTTYAYNQQQEQIAISTQTYNISSTSNHRDLGKTLTQMSCLVPGTLVQTDRGLVAIEKIQIGDMVLSQDPETAELALKPVLLTTIRAPKPTLRIVSEKNTIEATGGHLWWVSGRGWIKSRDLKPGMMLHTVTGNVEVCEVIENSTPQQTHNLVVDQFHTYFVGPSRVLSYDNSLVKPCLRTVPGFGVLAENVP